MLNEIDLCLTKDGPLCLCNELQSSRTERIRHCSISNTVEHRTVGFELNRHQNEFSSWPCLQQIHAAVSSSSSSADIVKTRKTKFDVTEDIAVHTTLFATSDLKLVHRYE